jgi:hypothetical protein
MGALPASAQVYLVPATSYYVAPTKPATSYYVAPTTAYYVPATSYYLPATSGYVPAASYYVPAATNAATPAYYVPSAPVSYYVPAVPQPPAPPQQKVERYYFYGNGERPTAPEKAPAAGETIIREYYYYPSKDEPAATKPATPANSTETILNMPPPEEALKKRETPDPNATPPATEGTAADPNKSPAAP